MVLESPVASKIAAARTEAFRIIACCAVQYRQMENVCHTLVDLLNKNEHFPGVLVELAVESCKMSFPADSGDALVSPSLPAVL